MSPTDQFLGSGGDQWIMVHASAEETQTAFAAQSVISSKNDHRIGTNEIVDQ